MKEPGELAYEASCRACFVDWGPWSQLEDCDRDGWAAVEAAIRADERAKTVEECAGGAEREKRLREALEKIAFGPPHEGEVKHVLNTLVEIAQAALKEVVE